MWWITPDERSRPELLDAIVESWPALIRRRGDIEKHSHLAERYGSAAILPAVVALLEIPSRACDIQTTLLRFVLQHDRARGLGLV